jgi:hypothetical protein
VSSLWTPGGEHRVPPPSDEPETEPWDEADDGPDIDPAAAEEMTRQLAEAQRRILAEPVENLVTNHVMGLYELAALHLSAEPPNLAQARLPIDAMGILVEQLGDRLPEPATLASALQQLRLAYVELSRGAGEAGDAAG